MDFNNNNVIECIIVLFDKFVYNVSFWNIFVVLVKDLGKIKRLLNSLGYIILCII